MKQSNDPLTLEQRLWGEFYVWLHQRAEYLRRQRTESKDARAKTESPGNHEPENQTQTRD